MIGLIATICERHPDQPWPHDRCLGPGMEGFRCSQGHFSLGRPLGDNEMLCAGPYCNQSVGYQRAWDVPAAHYFCPECGCVALVPGGTPAICEANGAGAEMIAVHQTVAEEIIRLGNARTEDDGTLLRIGPWATGRNLDHVGRRRWFLSRYANGRWRSTIYAATPTGLVRRAVASGVRR